MRNIALALLTSSTKLFIHFSSFNSVSSFQVYIPFFLTKKNSGNNKQNRRRRQIITTQQFQQLQKDKYSNSMNDERTIDSNDTNNNDHSVRRGAKLISPTELEKCGERLRNGGLVAFPTETVYGLGCNALDSSAIIKVFEAKERPLTDPLIAHVAEKEIAFQLWEASSQLLEGRALHALCDKFWPGPLTLVAKAAPDVPPLLMAKTGFVACRSPRHPISIALINAAKVPIAGPSANKFGHVSPTRSHHVWDDLKDEDVWIIKENDDENEESKKSQQKHSTTLNGDIDGNTPCCQVGVESSVAKIEMYTVKRGIDAAFTKKGRITLLRQGAISIRDIQDCLKESELADHFEVSALTERAINETEASVAPGQTIRHYSPDIPSFILSNSLRCIASRLPSSTSNHLTEDEQKILSGSVLIDFGGKFKNWKNFVLAYTDLSESADSAEATKGVFEALRWAEQISKANQILLPELSSDEVERREGCFNDSGSVSNTSMDALTLALKDRLTRAASGVVIDSLC